MVKHIVMFKLKDTLSKDEKLDVMNRFKAAIEALPASISEHHLALAARLDGCALHVKCCAATSGCVVQEHDRLFGGVYNTYGQYHNRARLDNAKVCQYLTCGSLRELCHEHLGGCLLNRFAAL